MKEVDGDLVEMFANDEFDVIIHGCNCFHAMDAGIAWQIEQKYPEVGFYDKLYSNHGDINKLSDHTVAIVPTGKDKAGSIVNLYTQFYPGPDFRLNALDLGFYKLSHRLTKDVRIGIPLIGAGIGGGDWDEIKPIIDNHMKFHNVTVVKYKKTKKNVSKR